MEHQFWHDRWDTNQIGFHRATEHPVLVEHFETVLGGPNGRIFVPLCGKTNDIGWLLAQGVSVVGAELVESAVQQLFENLSLQPEVERFGQLACYKSGELTVWVGDIFGLDRERLGAVTAVYDRAAIVALPPDLRQKYASHLIQLTRAASQLVLAFDYDQTKMEGPPFCVPADEIRRHYEASYDIELLGTMDVPGGLKGIVEADLNVWNLKSR